MKFNPKSEEQFKQERESRNLKPGVYEATIQGCKETEGQYGPQMELQVSVYGDDQEHQIRDWVGAGSEKLMHLCVAARRLDRYHAGELHPDDLIGATLRVEIAMKKPNAEGKVFPKVQGYLPPNEPAKQGGDQQPQGREKFTAKPAPEAPPIEDEIFGKDEIPF